MATARKIIKLNDVTPAAELPATAEQNISSVGDQSIIELTDPSLVAPSIIITAGMYLTEFEISKELIEFY